MKKNLPAPTAKEINDAHKLAKACAETAVENAIRCGELLSAKKADLDRGEFDPWIEKNCEFSRSSAYAYMKVAANSSRALDDFRSIQQALGYEKPKPTTNTPKGAVSVVKAPDDGQEATEETGNDRPAAPAFTGHKTDDMAPDDDAPERPDDADEDAALAAAEADYSRRVDAVMQSDDKLSEARAQLKQQSALVATLEITRDSYMRGKDAVTKMLQAEQRKVAKLEKENAKLRDEIENLRERIAIREEA